MIPKYRIDPSDERRLRASLSTINLVACASSEIAKPFQSIWASNVDKRKLDVGGPVRNTQSQNRIHGAGQLYSPKNRGLRGWESHLEKKAMILLDCDPDVSRYCAQPTMFRYSLDGRQRHFTPDLFVWRRQHFQIVEVKPRATADELENRRRFALFDAFFRRFRIPFLVLDESAINAEPRLRNCRMLLRYHDEALSAQDLTALQNGWRSGGASVENLAALLNGPRALDRVYASILRGHAQIDHRVPLSKTSMVWGL